MLIKVLKEKLSDIKAYHKVSAIKALLYQYMKRQIDQRDEVNAPKQTLSTARQSLTEVTLQISRKRMRYLLSFVIVVWLLSCV